MNVTCAWVCGSNLATLRRIARMLVKRDTTLAADRPWRDIRALGAAIERLRGRYVETRRALLARQAADADAVRGRIKVRPGFERLDSEQGYRVLRPVADAVFDTTPEQRYPTLVELIERFPAKLHSAENAADEALDEELTRATERPVVKVELKLRGQEIETREQLDTLLREIRERIGEQLAKGARVRLG